MLIRLARTLPLLAAFIALQGSILGGAAACALGEHRPTDATSMVSPAVVDPMATQAGSRSSGISAWASSDGSEASDGRVPCDHERMPEHCMLMPACSVFAVAAAQWQQQVDAPNSRIAPLVALAPVFETAPPELPPPRA